MQTSKPPARFTAFRGSKRVAAGVLAKVAAKVKVEHDQSPGPPILVFDNQTSRLLELDLRGALEDVLGRLAAPNAAPEPGEQGSRGPGRPKLGVVAREVTLLPRHWEWLGRQPGGASVALRKLVEEARRAYSAQDRLREARESAYRFMSEVAGDYPGFEEAARALFSGNQAKFHLMSAPWPPDVRRHARELAALAFAAEPQAATKANPCPDPAQKNNG